MSARHWFLPETPELLRMLRAQCAITVEAMDELLAWSEGQPGAADRVRDCEHRADEAKRELWVALRGRFSPPLDAEDLYTLSADLDEVLNASKDLVREMEDGHAARRTDPRDGHAARRRRRPPRRRLRSAG